MKLLVVGEVFWISLDELADHRGIDAVDQHQTALCRLRLVRIQQDAPRGPAAQTAPSELHAKALRIGELCARHGVSLPQAAMAFVAAHPAVASVVVGARDAAQITRNANLFAKPVPAELWSELVDAGLLRADAPVP